MAFMKTNLQKKDELLTSQFCSFITFLLPSLVNYRLIITLLVSKEVVKKDWCNKSNVFKELASTAVFHKKSKLIWFWSDLAFFL